MIEKTARRGDLILTEETRNTTFASFSRPSTSETFYRLATIAACTREGKAKSTVRFGTSSKYGVTGRSWVIGKDDADLAAISAEIESRMREDWQADTFASVDNAREFLSRFRSIKAA